MCEKRRFQRFPVYQSTFFKTSDPNKIFDCLIHDLSMNGILIESNYHLSQGDTITIAIRYGSKVYSEDVRIVREMRLITLRFGGEFMSEQNATNRKIFLSSITD